METYIQNKRSLASRHHRTQAEGGFSLLEMIVAMLILTIGLLGVASAIGYALMASNSGRGITNSKLFIVAILEQMETLRDTGQLHFNEISNAQVVGSTFTGFPDSFQPISRTPGPDGIFGTADDLMSPGADGIYGTPDDFVDPSLSRPGISRWIHIETVVDNDYLKKITVSLRYSPNGGTVQTLVCSSYLNDNEHGNYLP